MTKVLVIDDSREVAGMLETVLAANNCCVQTVHSGSIALQMLQESPFDVVITDILMPEPDGFEVIMAINRMRLRPRVIAITGGTVRLSREYLSEVARKLKVQQVFYKPLDVRELLNSVLLHEVAAAAAG